MDTAREWRWPWLISGVGLLLWGGFLWNFVHELRTLPMVWPPLLTFLLGTGLSLVLVYAGYRYGQESWIDSATGRRIVAWGLGGLVIVTMISGITILIRIAEQRAIAEPQLEILVSLNSGMVAGVLVGYLHERAQHEAADARQARDALAFLNRTLRHELLNGLNIIHGQASLLETERTDAEARSRLSTIESRSADMADLIDNVRVFAETFMGNEEIKPIHLSKLLEQRVAVTRETFPDAIVTADIPSDVSVHANEALGQVFENLLKNAVEHNDKPTPEVTVTVETTPDTATVHVADNGPGIPEEQRAELFEPNPDQAHGFGLHLVDTLVTHYDGEITVSENDPEGTVVTVTLPRANDVPGDVAGQRTHRLAKTHG